MKTDLRLIIKEIQFIGLWPVDSSRLWQALGKWQLGSECFDDFEENLPSLLAWLPDCHLHLLNHLCAIQVLPSSLKSYLFAGDAIRGTWTWVRCALWTPTKCCRSGNLKWIRSLLKTTNTPPTRCEPDLWDWRRWKGIRQWATVSYEEGIQETNYAWKRDTNFPKWGYSKKVLFLH